MRRASPIDRNRYFGTATLISHRVLRCIVKMSTSRGPLQSKKIDMKSISGTCRQERNQGITWIQPWMVKVEFVPYLPIQNQLLTLTIRKNQVRGRKWGLPRAQPIDKNRCIEALRVISHRYLRYIVEMDLKNGPRWGRRMFPRQ